MPRTLIRKSCRWRWVGAACGITLAFGFAFGWPALGCNASQRRAAPEPTLYPPAPQTPRVVALGNVRGAAQPTQTEVNLSLVLFGAEPATTVQLASPIGIAVRERDLIICDLALRSVLRWIPAERALLDFVDPAAVAQPFAVSTLDDRRALLCDRNGVMLLDERGRAVRRFQLADGDAFRASDAALVGECVWVTNLAQHRIEVFDFETGRWLRSIGEHGAELGQFAVPRSLATTPAGDVCVVDVLNNRVQILAPEGDFIGVVGGPGDQVGTFGRPKDVAVGPDGTIFVVDAFSQRVHAFAPDGAPLLAFGEPDSGVGALSLPGGIAISSWIPDVDIAPPLDPRPAYYVLVTEQLASPGVRIFGWLPPGENEQFIEPRASIADSWVSPNPELAADNPHWKPGECSVCHQQGPDGRIAPIPESEVDALCFSCHDGVRAFADPHPIGRPARTETVHTPEHFPTLDGDIGCLTCHDIERHCAADAQRNLLNPGMLRDFDPQRPLEYCTECHTADVGGRFSPHQQRDAQGRIRQDACLFCHTQRPEVPADGERTFDPQLRTASSDLCLNCHTKHWDLSPLGHVERPVPEDMRHWMVMRELSQRHDISEAELEALARKSTRGPAHLPLGNGNVTCYTCHNPHYDGLFPPGSELGALAENPSDRASALRTDWINLCSECHRR